MQPQPRYVVITPARDEEDNLPNTIASLAGQTVRPTEWVIVDDGSTDRTGQIADEAAAKYPWIRVLHRANRGFRKAGGGVMEAVYQGYDALVSRDWQFLVKLDGDLYFEPDYFERCFAEFAKDARLGVGGGVIYHVFDGREEVEKHPMFHVRGATKIYRRECWNDIEPLIIAPGWDTMDEVKANMTGWTSRSFPDIRLRQYRFTGDADGQFKTFIKNGRANYITGYHPLFMLVKCVTRIFRKPYGVAAVGLFYGFFSSYFRDVQQIEDRALIRYLRRQQLRRLFLRPSIWK
ncbi:MAG: glycosyltransferase family 2 protein [Planctomycetota bacterium]